MSTGGTQVGGAGLGAGGVGGAGGALLLGNHGSIAGLAHTGFTVVTPTLTGIVLVVGGYLLRRTARVRAANLGPVGGMSAPH